MQRGILRPDVEMFRRLSWWFACSTVIKVPRQEHLMLLMHVRYSDVICMYILRSLWSFLHFKGQQLKRGKWIIFYLKRTGQQTHTACRTTTPSNPHTFKTAAYVIINFKHKQPRWKRGRCLIWSFCYFRKVFNILLVNKKCYFCEEEMEYSFYIEILKCSDD